jgi:peptidoglycan/LPS O-acetylase OafA/YrhL
VAILSERFQRLLASRVLGFFGAISYPLYLLHENMMIAMIAKLGRVWPDAPAPLLVASALAAISCLAYVIAKHAERPLKQAIDGVSSGRSTQPRGI